MPFQSVTNFVKCDWPTQIQLLIMIFSEIFLEWKWPFTHLFGPDQKQLRKPFLSCSYIAIFLNKCIKFKLEISIHKILQHMSEYILCVF
jgi:hypothetical protein